MKQFVFIIAFLLPVLCKGQAIDNSENKNMDMKVEGFLEKRASLMKSYPVKPMYYIQINKQECKVIVSVNDILIGHQFVKDEGQTMLLPINAYLRSSGEFSYGIKVLPRKNGLMTAKTYSLSLNEIWVRTNRMRVLIWEKLFLRSNFLPKF